MKIFILIFLSGIISVDRNSALNLMLSRPFIISIIIGFLFGWSDTLFLIGVIFELLGIMDLPVGAHIPKDDTFAAYALCSTYALGYLTNIVDLITAFLIVLLLMRFLTAIDVYSRNTTNKYLYHKYEKASSFDSKKLLFIGILISFLKGLLFYNLATVLVILTVKFINITTSVNINLFLTMMVVVVSAYFFQFLDIHGIKKYILLIGGFLIGWLIS